MSTYRLCFYLSCQALSVFLAFRSPQYAAAAPADSGSAKPSAPTAPAPAGLSKQNVQNLLGESLVVLGKAKDTLRLASAKLPDLISDNREFRRMDREVELCRDEVYPAVTSAQKLKDDPHLLRDAVRMYVALRTVEMRCLRLSDKLSGIEGGSQLSTQVFDVANRIGQINLKLQPYFFRLVDAYQSEAAETKVEEYMQWQGEQIQGPVL